MARSAVKFEISAVDKTKQAFDSAMRGINNLESRFMSIMGPVTALASVAGLGALITKTANTGDVFDDMSARTGVAVENLSGLSHMAKLTGTDIDSVEKSLKYLTGQMLDVSRGSGTAKKTFDELGISVLDQNGRLRGTTDVLIDMAGKLSGMTDETRQAALAMEMLGARSGAQLVPMLKLGKDALEDMKNEMKRRGSLWTAEDAAAAGRYNDELENMKDAAGGLGRAFAMELIPELTKGATAMTGWIAANKGWIGDELNDKVTALKENIAAINKYKGVLAGTLGLTWMAVHVQSFVALNTALYTTIAGLEILKQYSQNREPFSLQFEKRIEDRSSGDLSDLINADIQAATGKKIQLTFEPVMMMPDKKGIGEDIQKLLPSLGRFTMPAIDNRELIKSADEAKAVYYDAKNVFSSAFTFPKSIMSLDFQTAGLSDMLKTTKTARTAYDDLLALGGRKALMPEMSYTFKAPALSSWLDTSMYETAQQYDSDLLALRNQNQESWIKRSTEGYEQQKALAAFYFEEEFGSLTENDERKILARGTLNNELEIMEREHLAQVRNDNLAAMMQFGSTWGSYMFSMMEQSGNAWENIEAGFKRMLTRMTVEATAAGLFNLITGGVGGGFTGGFTSYLSKAFGFRAFGGDVQAGRPYIVGEKGVPELFVPRTSGTILPNASAAMRAGTGLTTINNKTKLIIVRTDRDPNELDAYQFAALAERAQSLGLFDRFGGADGDA